MIRLCLINLKKRSEDDKVSTLQAMWNPKEIKPIEPSKVADDDEPPANEEAPESDDK
jgi:hypothetical protein